MENFGTNDFVTRLKEVTTEHFVAGGMAQVLSFSLPFSSSSLLIDKIFLFQSCIR